MLLKCILSLLAARIVYAGLGASIQRNEFGGITFTIPDENYKAVAVHYSINKELRGSVPGQWNNDIWRKNGSKWIHKNYIVDLKLGDKVNFWLYAVKDDWIGLKLTDQTWTCCFDAVTMPPDTGNKSPECTTYPCLVFEDNFDTFDFDVWEHEISAGGGGNWEFQYYLNNRSNSYVTDGKLFIKPTLTTDKYGEGFLTRGDLDLWGYVANDICTSNMFYGCKRQGDGVHIINPIQSARLRSIRGFSMKYGKLEVEAKMPTGDWIWPAIWLLPKWNRYGGWPASGEIDLCESRGNSQLVDSKGRSIGVNAMGSTLHFGTDFWNNGWEKAHKEKILSSGTFADGFHKYVLEWDEDGIRTTVDGDEVLNVRPDDGGFFKIGEFEKLNLENPWRNSGSKMAPFDQEFYIILNVAIGGTGGYWEQNLNGKPWNNFGETASRDFWNARGAWYPTWNPDKNNGEDAAMQINYIRYWKMKP